MVAYIMLSLLVAVLGLAAVAGFLYVALPHAQRRRELARHRGEFASQAELENFIRRVDRVTTDDALDHLDEERKSGD